MNNYIYYSAAGILVSGLFIMLTSDNYIKKIVGLGIFQSSVLIFYIAFGKIYSGIPPIFQDNVIKYSSPLPHVLMLTAIVVGFSTLSVGLALIYKIYKHFATTSESEIINLDGEDDIS